MKKCAVEFNTSSGNKYLESRWKAKAFTIIRFLSEFYLEAYICFVALISTKYKLILFQVLCRDSYK